MTLVGESSCVSHLADRKLPALQKLLGPVHSAPQRVLVGTDPRTFFEEVAEVMGTHSREIRKFPQPRFLGVVLSHEVYNAIEPRRWHAVSKVRLTRIPNRVSANQVVRECHTQ